MSLIFFPKNLLIDIRIACDKVHIRSYLDSANALIALFNYALTDGDLQQPQRQRGIVELVHPLQREKHDRPIRMFNDEIIECEHMTNDGVNY